MESLGDIENCMICFQILNKPANCSTCKKYLCQVHIASLNKCPACRAEPFNPVADTELEKKLAPLRKAKRESERDTTVFTCCAKNCRVKGSYKQMERHHKFVHPYLPLDMMLYGDFYEIQEEEEVSKPSKQEESRADFAATNARNPPAGERKKTVDYNQALRMIRHCNICPNTECLTLYSGPWGSFIGGSEGVTHFDLTSCERGRSLNIAAGWNYSNPRI